MGKKEDLERIAQARWLAGESVSAIAREMGLHRNTVQGWKAAANWQRIKDALPPPASPPRPKLINFDRLDRPRREPLLEIGDLDTLEGQTALIDRLIGFALAEIASPASPQQYSAALAAVPRLLEARERVNPRSDTALILELCGRFRDPAELLAAIKKAGFGQRPPASKVAQINSRL